ncbi:MAG: DUF2911 domain-containing protein [Candidatus Pseudobacter hemicellulosilyticus]|uniref:DUF2911 domain-containing protein n=1 Tax=Candidatus Pseudobacter hemicellulosilyticus TaxID=3121375 RepID=A0AAJ5WTD3_9BACT|nr:MAG: DUF2911 domain-containing protein [Pseudobacter sp.]
MKHRIVFLLLLSISTGAWAQTKAPAIDKSPMDMAYYPINYPVLKIQHKATEPLACRIVYSRPQKNGRSVFGELVEYGKIWRLGANEATEIELFKDAKVGEQKLKKGRYTMYAIPFQDKWTIIFNKDLDSWGAFLYDEKKDVLRVSVNTEKQNDPAEAYTMLFEKSSVGVNLVMMWDNVKASLPFVF